MIKPCALPPNARIALVAPSGALRPPKVYDNGIHQLQSLGFELVRYPSCDAAYGYLAGTDRLRADDLNRAFADPNIDAIWCVRGGYGATRLLHLLDYDLARQNPKPLIGYSDITALHIAYGQRSGLVTFHGPVLTSDPDVDPIDPLSLESVLCALRQTAPCWPLAVQSPLKTLHGGQAAGLLIGGNLSLLAALCGTPYAPDVRGKLLFIEEVGEHTYAVDRMLTQLRLAGLFDACAGILFGQFTNVTNEHPDFAFTIENLIQDIVLPSGRPLVYDLPCGHETPNLTLPMGLYCALDADAGTLVFLENAVI